ncbi:MAG: hypothetical protein ACXAD7_04770 [Candidatus Kariarchaeaceae archaeon]|jgi:hypothetical protein
MFKWVLVAIMTIHGLIHLMGGLSELDLAEIEDISGETLFTLSNTARKVLGVIWLLVVVLFLIASYGLISENDWWQIIAIIAVAVSQILIIIWWTDAKFGTIANFLIIIGMVYRY